MLMRTFNIVLSQASTNAQLLQGEKLRPPDPAWEPARCISIRNL